MQFNLLSIVFHGALTVLVAASGTIFPPLDLRSKRVYEREGRNGNDYMSPKLSVVKDVVSEDVVQKLVADVYEDLQASDKAIEGIEVNTFVRKTFLKVFIHSFTLEPVKFETTKFFKTKRLC